MNIASSLPKSSRMDKQYSRGSGSCRRTQEAALNKFRVSQDEILNIVEDDEAFYKLRMAVGKSGAVTNEHLKQLIHFYARNSLDEMDASKNSLDEMDASK